MVIWIAINCPQLRQLKETRRLSWRYDVVERMFWINCIIYHWWNAGIRCIFVAFCPQLKHYLCSGLAKSISTGCWWARSRSVIWYRSACDVFFPGGPRVGSSEPELVGEGKFCVHIRSTSTLKTAFSALDVAANGIRSVSPGDHFRLHICL